MGFRRKEHEAVVRLLSAMDGGLLERTRCYFGGGTAVVLQNGEYRLSRDVDFLCADVDGYRELRVVTAEQGLKGLFPGPGVRAVREFRADQYGIRTILSVDDQQIRFEIVREGRVRLDGAMAPEFGVPVLRYEDQICEKLLANADRGLDRGAGFRDAIDLGMLLIAGGGLPSEALRSAESAYGRLVMLRLRQVLELLDDSANRTFAAAELDMRPEDVARALAALAGVAGTDGESRPQSLS